MKLIILFRRDMVGTFVQVPEVDRGEHGDMRLTLRLYCTPERRVQGEVEGGKL